MLKISLLRVVLLLIFLLCGKTSYSQTTFLDQYPDTLNKKRLRGVIASELGGYVTGLSFLSFVWYKGKERVPFHFYDDTKGYLQIDKAGHAFGAYRQSYAAYHALRWAGVSKKKALLYGGPMGLIFQTPIEIFDGLHEGWGFSWPDMVANTFGSVLFTTQEALFDEQVVFMKFSYSPSIYPDYHTTLGESHLERFFLDYNAHTYWLSLDLKRVTKSRIIPKWLNLAVGYSANGMIKEFENPSFYRGEPFPHLDRYRQFLISLDINCAKIPTRKPWVRKLLRAVNLIKVPFPAIEINRLDQVKLRPFYF